MTRHDPDFGATLAEVGEAMRASAAARDRLREETRAVVAATRDLIAGSRRLLARAAGAGACPIAGARDLPPGRTG